MASGGKKRDYHILNRLSVNFPFSSDLFDLMHCGLIESISRLPMSINPATCQTNIYNSAFGQTHFGNGINFFLK